MNTFISKSFEVNHNIEDVWTNLANPEKVVVCVPGASLTEKVDDNNFKGEVELKFGPVKAKYGGLITFLERDAATHTMKLKGTGTDSKGKGGAEMNMHGHLEDKGNATLVSMTMDISITGMLAQFGNRLVNDASNHVFDQFVGNFKSQLEGKQVDNTLNAGSMVGSVIKGIFGSNKS